MALFFVILCMLVSPTLGQVQCQECSTSGLDVYGGYRYVFFHGIYRTFDETRAHCQSLGGDMVIITSQQQNDFISDRLPREIGDYYIGLEDMDNDDECRWIGGTIPGFSNWENPLYSHHSRPYCGVMRSHTNDQIHGKWNRVTCTSPRRHICQIPVYIPPSIVQHPDTPYGDKSGPLVFQCRATGTPEPEFYWKKDGVLIDIANNDRASLDGGNLVINPMQDEDRGVYQCFAENNLGTAISRKTTTSLAYMVRFADTSPLTFTVRVGEFLRLKCGGYHGPPNGYPDPLIYWTDASARPSPVVYDARVNQDGKGTLVFSNVIASDAKGYYCNAVNNVVGVSQRSSKFTVIVKTDLPPVEIPSILVACPPSNAVAIRTEEYQMKCMAIGHPTPEITWKREEEQLQSGGRVSIDETGQDLVISTVEFSDSGTYTCVASNKEGTDEFSSTLAVESAAYFPVPPSDETKIAGESVYIECRAEGVPQPTVNVLVNGQRWAYFQSNIDTARWTVVTGIGKSATISITNLQTVDTNVFQCIATNKYREELTNVVLNVVLNCQVPALTTGLRVTECQAGSEVSTGATCRYSCASGYYLVGRSSVTCGLDGTLSPAVPTCYMNCQVPALTTGLRVTGCQAGSKVSTGASCRYSCANGYSLWGTTSVTCGSDGKFFPAVPTCQDECPPMLPAWICKDKCATTSCPNYPDAHRTKQCRMYNCGQCTPQFFNPGSNYPLDCWG